MWKKTGRILTLLILIGSASACTSRVVVTRVHRQSGAAQMEGVFYALPRTTVTVAIPFVREDKEPGEFHAIAYCFFPNEQPIMTASTSFKMDNPTFGFRGEPDPEQIFLVKTKGHYLEDKTLQMELTEAGVMTKVEAESKNLTLEFATKAIKTIASIGASAATKGLLFGAARMGITANTRADSTELKNIDSDFWDFLRTSSRECRREYDRDPDTFYKAWQVYRKIAELHNTREKMVSESGFGQGGSAEEFQLRLKEMDAIIEGYMSQYFVGTTTTAQWSPTFEYTPPTLGQQGPTDPYIRLFEFSETDGVCGVHPDQGVIVPRKFHIVQKVCPDQTRPCNDEQKIETACANTADVLLRVSKEANANQISSKVLSASFGQGGERGFYYRIPGMAVAKLLVRPYRRPELEKGRSKLQIAQYGTVVSLPASTGGRTTKYTLALYEASGALKNFSLGSSALIQQSLLEDLGGAATSVIDAKAKREDAQAAQKDELKQLERKRQLLEEMVKIKEAEEKLKKQSP